MKLIVDLMDDLSDEEIENLKNEIRGLDGVFSVEVNQTVLRELPIPEDDVCDCGDPFPESGYCMFCGVHRRDFSSNS